MPTLRYRKSPQKGIESQLFAKLGKLTSSLGVILLVIVMVFVAPLFHLVQRLDTHVNAADLRQSPNKVDDGEASSDGRMAADSELARTAGRGSLSCDQVRDFVASGDWEDPNEGRIYARQVSNKVNQTFYVSVHNEHYDEVRWESIFINGKYYEDLVHSRFLQILHNQPTSLVIDVGANIGYYTLLSLSLGHEVISFEINPANLMRICESLTINQWKDGRDAILFQNGVSDQDGVALQVIVPRNPGQAFMKPLEDKARAVDEVDPGDTTTNHAYTTTISLDAFAQERGWLKRPGFSIVLLKLDVEGKEPAIIDGAQKLLQSGIIKNVLTEFRRLGRSTIQKAIHTLIDAGFVIVHEERGKLSLADTKEYLEDLRKELHHKMNNVDLWFQRE
jgi:FkbM family methyltransferase